MILTYAENQSAILRILSPSPHPQYLFSCIQHFLNTREIDAVLW